MGGDRWDLMKEATQKSENLAVSENQFLPFGHKDISLSVKAGDMGPLEHWKCKLHPSNIKPLIWSTLDQTHEGRDWQDLRESVHRSLLSWNDNQTSKSTHPARVSEPPNPQPCVLPASTWCLLLLAIMGFVGSTLRQIHSYPLTQGKLPGALIWFPGYKDHWPLVGLHQRMMLSGTGLFSPLSVLVLAWTRGS